MTKTDLPASLVPAMWRLPRHFTWDVPRPRGHVRRTLLGLGLAEARRSGETAFHLEHRAGRSLALHVDVHLTECSAEVTRIAGAVHMRRDTALFLLGLPLFNAGLILWLGARMPTPFQVFLLLVPAVFWTICLWSRRHLYKRLERAFAAS
jgi:hypothetical protein